MTRFFGIKCGYCGELCIKCRSRNFTCLDCGMVKNLTGVVITSKGNAICFDCSFKPKSESSTEKWEEKTQLKQELKNILSQDKRSYKTYIEV